MHLLPVHTRRKLRVVRKGPSVSEVGVIALIQFESADSQVNQRAAMEITEDLARGLAGEVRPQSSPHTKVSGRWRERGEHWRCRMRERVLPQIDVKIHLLSGSHKCSGVWKSRRIPDEGAGIRMRLPSRLKAEDIAWDTAIAQIFCKGQDVLRIEMHFGAIPKSKSPLWRQHTAAGEEVVSLHCLHQLRPGEQIDIDTRSARNLNEHAARILPAAGVHRLR